MSGFRVSTSTLCQGPRLNRFESIRCSPSHSLKFSRRWQSTQHLAHEVQGHNPQAASKASQVKTSTRKELPPHSLMPLKMLLRASLVSTVTSKPWLLNLSLKILTYLTTTRISLLQVNKNPIIHGILKQTFYNHFCAGENGLEVTKTVSTLKDIGFKGVILTYAREIVVDANLDEQGKGTKDAAAGKGDLEAGHFPDIETWKQGVLESVRLIGQDDFLAIKLTGAGATVMTSLSDHKTIPPQMSEALNEICTEALTRQVKILVDAEQQSIQPGIDAVALSLMQKYNTPTSTTQQATVYNTYQAYLKSCPDTLRNHMSIAVQKNFTLGVKLVRGAYMASEPRHLIHDTKSDTDASYNGIITGLLTQSYASIPHSTAKSTPTPNPPKFPTTALFVATHNKESALLAHSLHSTRLTTSQPTLSTIAYGQLLGMADEVSCSLLQLGKRGGGREGATEQKGPQVYKCLSWGPLEDCLSYLLRRARENKDAVGRSKAEYVAVWAEIRRRVKGVVGL